MCDPECGPLAAGVSSSSLGICLFMGYGCGTGNGKTGRMGRTGKCDTFGPLSFFQCNIDTIHTVQTANSSAVPISCVQNGIETSAHSSGQWKRRERRRRQRDDPCSRGPDQRGQAAAATAGRRTAVPTAAASEVEALSSSSADLQ